MTEPPDPPPTIATMRTIGMVWAVVGALAIVVGAIATVFAIVVFGFLALALGGVLVGVQSMRARSAIRASRTLTNAPAPPAAPPSASPPGPPSDRSNGPPDGRPDGPPNGPSNGRPRAADLRSRGPEGPVGSPEVHADGDTADDESTVIDAEPVEDAGSAADRHRSSRSISDEDDGTGSTSDEDDPPRRDA